MESIGRLPGEMRAPDGVARRSPAVATDAAGSQVGPGSHRFPAGDCRIEAGRRKIARRSQRYRADDSRPPLLPERRDLTSAAAARIKTTMTSRQIRPIPHVIAGVIPFIMVRLVIGSIVSDGT